MTEHSLETEKQIADRLQIVLDDPVLFSIYQKFGGEVFRRSSVFHGLARFLKENDVSGKCCFEIGTWNGLTAIVLSRFFERVVTVDIVDRPEKLAILESAGVKNVWWHVIPDNSYKKRVMAEAAAEAEIDFAYLDGDHAADTQRDWNLVSDCGRVLFHECWSFQPAVWNLVRALPQQNVSYGGTCFALWKAG